jgi:hypothetical protein
MKKSKVNKIKELLQEECEQRGVPYSKGYLRRAKRMYGNIPSGKRDQVGIQMR